MRLCIGSKSSELCPLCRMGRHTARRVLFQRLLGFSHKMRSSVKITIAILSGLAIVQIYSSVSSIMTTRVTARLTASYVAAQSGVLNSSKAPTTADTKDGLDKWTSDLPERLRGMYNITVDFINQLLTSVNASDASLVWGATLRRISADILTREATGSMVKPAARTPKSNTQEIHSSALQSALASTLKTNKNVQSLQCPLMPPGLVGLTPSNQTEPNPQLLANTFSFLKPGGHYSPDKCQPRQKVAILIPYRNRWPHLQILLNNLLPFLIRQQSDFTIFVIEQQLPSTFNRALLLNVGVLESLKQGNFTCFIFHDVDLIPLNDHNLYRCGNKPLHMAVGINKHKYGLPYQSYFGGIVAMSLQQVMTINGNSNLYFGWGGEDDDLLARVKYKGYSFSRYPMLIGRYDMIKHTIDKGNEANPMRWKLLQSSGKRMLQDGLNTTRYNVTSLQHLPLYTWIKVSVNQTQILKNAPEYIQAFIRKLALRPKMDKSTPALKQKSNPNKTLQAEPGKTASANTHAGDVPTRPFLTLPLPTRPLPTSPLPSRPLPTSPLPTRPLPTRPLPTRPLPTRPLPTSPLPSRPLPTSPLPSRPLPTSPLPSRPLPTRPLPTRPLPTRPLPTRPLPSRP
ncbi:uncharacterized protein [Littorina saxatilis]|uniref:uncharacterized protein n=1 Tax=Littorina saxatilis TaxID=31220 RepID=UPI0038B63D02